MSRSDKINRRELLLYLISMSLFVRAKESPGTVLLQAVNAQPSIDQILQKYVDAIGGKEAAQKVNSRIMKGTLVIVNTGASGFYEVYSKSPDKFLARAKVNSFGTLSRGLNGTVAWASNPMTGASELKGEFLAAARREADPLRNYRLKELYTQLVVKGRRNVEGKEAWLVEAIPLEGRPDWFYFDIQTGLLLRMDTQSPPREGMVIRGIYYDDYREVDGIKLPFSIHEFTPVYQMEIKFLEIKHNLPIDEKEFDIPIAVQIQGTASRLKDQDRG
jgi:zinc protease